ncbi:MAG TPA: hypothetical protein VFB82_15315, partial [Blastocatellia bacterium]|nr:hypothetical protein [Blastocatellia bacterium]
RRGVGAATPKGLHPVAQGCRTRLPWVTSGADDNLFFTSKRLRLAAACFLFRQRAAQPLRGWG